MAHKLCCRVTLLLSLLVQISAVSYDIEVPHGEESCVSIKVPEKSMIRYVKKEGTDLIYFFAR